MALWMTAVFLLRITPVRLGAAAHWERGLPRAAVGVMLWGVAGRAAFYTSRDENGRLRLTASVFGKTVPLAPGKNRAGQGLRLLLMALRSNSRQPLLRYTVKVRCLEARMRLGCRDAAWAALAVGLIRAAAAAVPLLRVQCVPALGGQTEVHLRCIADARLGTLLAAALAGRVKRRRGRKEEKPWIIPSGA